MLSYTGRFENATQKGQHPLYGGSVGRFLDVKRHMVYCYGLSTYALLLP